MPYASVSQTAARWGLSSDYVRRLCRCGGVPGAMRQGRNWRIPSRAPSPQGSEKLITLSQACGILGISRATGQNWMRAGRLAPARYDGRRPLFAPAHVTSLLESLRAGGGRLSSRRNKSLVQGALPYQEYLPSGSPNLPTARRLLTLPEETGLGGDVLIRPLLAETALRLLLTALKQPLPAGCALPAFAQGRLALGPYAPFVSDLLGTAPLPPQLAPLLEPAFSSGLSLLPGEDFLGFLYLSLRSLGTRKAAGAYYTPAAVVEQLTASLARSPGLKGKTVFDPCCGSGGFLLSALAHGADPALLAGQDADPIAAALARLNIILCRLPKDPSFLWQAVTCGDSLLSPPPGPFDLVVGNPPWGCAFPPQALAVLRKRYTVLPANSAESFALFTELALSLGGKNGTVAYVLPQALLHTAAHRPLRELIERTASIRRLTLLENAFPSIHCPALLLVLEKSPKPSVSGCRVVHGKNTFEAKVERPLQSLHLTDSQYRCLEHFRQLPGATTLQGNASFALGIVTGDNKGLLHTRPGPGREPVYRGGDVRLFRLARPSAYLRPDPARLQQCAPLELYRAPQKLLYRFICGRPVFALDSSGGLTLNSCNLLIPRLEGYPLPYLLALLNSRAAAFFLAASFRSVKVLRSHLEQLPLPCAPQAVQLELAALTEAIRLGEGDPARLYDAIDRQVMELYRLSRPQQQIILELVQDTARFLPAGIPGDGLI